MPKIASRNDPISQAKRADRENRIHPPKASETIEKMYANFLKGIDELKTRMENGETDAALESKRAKLGDKAWSLEHLYGYNLTDFNLESLGIVPSMGEHLSRKGR